MDVCFCFMVLNGQNMFCQKVLKLYLLDLLAYMIFYVIYKYCLQCMGAKCYKQILL